MIIPTEHMLKHFLEYSLDYLDFIRSKPCAVTSHKCFGRLDPDHLETIGKGGDSKKPKIIHYSAVPLCRTHHQERHRIGTAAFNEKYNIDLWRYAFQLTIEFLTGLEACWRK